MAETVMRLGYDVFAMKSRFAAHSGPSGRNSTAFLEWCVDKPDREDLSGGDDILHTGKYRGSTIHPYETT